MTMERFAFNPFQLWDSYDENEIDDLEILEIFGCDEFHLLQAPKDFGYNNDLLTPFKPLLFLSQHDLVRRLSTNILNPVDTTFEEMIASVETKNRKSKTANNDAIQNSLDQSESSPEFFLRTPNKNKDQSVEKVNPEIELDLDYQYTLPVNVSDSDSLASFRVANTTSSLSEGHITCSKKRNYSSNESPRKQLKISYPTQFIASQLSLSLSPSQQTLSQPIPEQNCNRRLYQDDNYTRDVDKHML